MLYRFVLLKIATLITLFLLGGCAGLAFDENLPRLAFAASGTDTISRSMPVIVSERPRHSYNRIGQPEIVSEAQRVTLRINPAKAVVYTEKRLFETTNGQYTNLIYRLHFEKVPFSLLPFNLTTGKNVGLLLVVTLNSQQQAVLLTTVHTCGCYLAIQPTNYLPKSAYPDNWNTHQQSVYGAVLPGLLQLSGADDEKFVIYLQDETHRVNHIDVLPLDKVIAQYAVQPLTLRPMSDLDKLPRSAGSESGGSESARFESMFETSGADTGYVRGVSKPFEFLLVSWWALDSRVGVDKRYGMPGDDGPSFYTSLKPWARQASDMRDFPGFLNYWGWRL
ncbi:hypothetical protein [Neptunomonas sp.]|uniref:hypothetical protein n=1 Tax=Neptunomonas sp. TaxID=1971898 RepID=UPI0035689520